MASINRQDRCVHFAAASPALIHCSAVSRVGAFASLSLVDRLEHLYLIGQTGTGKFLLMLNMLAQDFRSGRGVALLISTDSLPSGCF